MTAIRQAASDAARLWRLALVKGSPDARRIRAIVGRLVTSARRRRLEVLAHFLRLLRRDRDRRAVHVTSAIPLDPATRSVIEASLSRRYRREMETSFDVDPALIAGIRLHAASDVYDDS